MTETGLSLGTPHYMSPELAAALSKALEKVSADRLESAKAFGDALHKPSFRVANIYQMRRPCAWHCLVSRAHET